MVTFPECPKTATIRTSGDTGRGGAGSDRTPDRTGPAGHDASGADANRPSRQGISFAALAHIESRWLAMTLSVLAIALMGSLGAFTIYNYRALQLDAYSTVGNSYIDGLLAPYALSRLNDNLEEAEALRSINSALADPNRIGTLSILRVWLPDGTLLYSSDGSDVFEDHDAADLREALQGTTVIRLDDATRPASQDTIDFPHLEIYAPIHDPATGATIAVGEIYQDATEILSDRAFVERVVWIAMIKATLGVLALLALSFRQSDRLREKLEQERILVARNHQLKIEADRARLDAVQANEQVLNLVGADLHDGPVQLLGLMSLMSDEQDHRAPAGMPSRTELAQQAMTELRTISTGLILPELDRLSASEVVELAIARHRSLTAQNVLSDLGALHGDLDMPHKVCLYRVVQEGLTNASRHAAGCTPTVTVRQEGAMFDIRIRSDRGTAEPARDPRFVGLGLQGMRRRLDAIGGDLRMSEAEAHVTLCVRMPTGAASGAA